MWDTVDKTGHNAKQEAMKRQLLLSWIVNPRFDSGFFTMVQSVSKSLKMKCDLQWCSWKEVVDRYGNEEANEMIEDGCFSTRANPDNPKRLQYMVRSDKMSSSVNQASHIYTNFIPSLGKTKGSHHHNPHPHTQDVHQ
jgi:hypothetical protein